MNDLTIVRMAWAACALLLSVESSKGMPGDTMAVAGMARLVITSDAESSFVYIDGRETGVTPLTLDSIPAGVHRVRVISASPWSWYSRVDSATIALSPGEARQLKFSVLLPFTPPPVTLHDNLAVVSGNAGADGKSIGIWISGGMTVAAGVVAAYSKIAADNRNDAYLSTGDPSLLSQRRRLDVTAGIALAVTQVAFAVLTYLLLGQ
jgi:hypothetical protein